VIGEGSTVGPGASVEALAVVGRGCRVGAGAVLRPHVVLYDGTEVGERCELHAGAVLGSDGFGYVTRGGRHEKVTQAGRVKLEAEVEVGANSTIDRATVGETSIGAGTKIDNLVQIAHGVTVGRDVLLAAQVGIAGSTSVEDRVTLAGQVGVAGHLTVGKGVVATAQSGIPNSVEAGSFISGYPAIDNRDWLKSSAIFRKLPELKKALADLQQRLDALEEKSKR
jgi:UDP-3-O-[3-hydroxymyristoyl] glucosamine N-acyltransferase